MQSIPETLWETTSAVGLRGGENVASTTVSASASAPAMAVMVMVTVMVTQTSWIHPYDDTSDPEKQKSPCHDSFIG